MNINLFVFSLQWNELSHMHVNIWKAFVNHLHRFAGLCVALNFVWLVFKFISMNRYELEEGFMKHILLISMSINFCRWLTIFSNEKAKIEKAYTEIHITYTTHIQLRFVFWIWTCVKNLEKNFFILATLFTILAGKRFKVTNPKYSTLF